MRSATKTRTYADGDVCHDRRFAVSELTVSPKHVRPFAVSDMTLLSVATTSSTRPFTVSDMTSGCESTLTSPRKLGRENWVDDTVANECARCEKQFHTFRRRHHCRACGKVFCRDCSNYFAGVHRSHYAKGEEKKRRVCADCHDSTNKRMESFETPPTSDDDAHLEESLPNSSFCSGSTNIIAGAAAVDDACIADVDDRIADAPTPNVSIDSVIPTPNNNGIVTV
jgi:hypothetical protein